MPRVLRKILSLRSAFGKPQDISGETAEEKWIADFSKPQQPPFDIKSESSHDANLCKIGSRHYLSLGLKKTGCIAWAEAPGRRYRDQVIQARVCLDAWGSYAAAGIMFRMMDEETYYSFLVSNKAYFRLDVFRNGTPMPLIAWTELPNKAASEMAVGNGVDFTLIAYGSHIIILIRNEWAAEVNDSTLLEGGIAFTAASYEDTDDTEGFRPVDEGRAPSLLLSSMAEHALSYSAELFLESLVVDSRISEVAALYEKWKDAAGIDPRCRFRLAETYTAMNQHKAALIQLTKAWESPGCIPEQRQLLLAGRLAQALGLTAEAERYISSCFQDDVDSPEGKEALGEMAKILYASERFGELKDYCQEALKLRANDPIIKTFQGHAYWNLKEYKEASAAYDAAFEFDRKNGILAKNAANVYEVLGKKKEALDRYLAGGRAFLETENYDDLGLIIPKLLALGEDNYDAHGLAGKWAFGIDDWETAAKEFKKAETLRKKKKGQPRDAALSYLEALLLIRNGKRAEALRLLEEAANLEKDYVLFRFKLAENRFLLKNDPNDPKLRSDLKKALALAPDDGWVNNFAAQVCLAKGDFDSAEAYLKKAAAALGEIPAIKVNRAELLYHQGSLDKALELLTSGKTDDPEGMMANCAGNFLTMAGRFEEADEQYRKAVRADPNNTGYLLNRASCLIELGLYGEADTILTTVSPAPDVLELISYVASKKGEFLRAETACRQALKMDPRHTPSLFSLCWILASRAKLDEGEQVLDRLDKMDLDETEISRRTELRSHYDSLFYSRVSCFSCNREWKVRKNSPPVQSMRLFAMPPDDLPAGTCPECGKTRCIGCAKGHLDDSDRFTCPDCHKPLKLTNEGLKKLIYDWAVGYGPQQK